MPTQHAVVGSADGLHARPAAALAQLVAASGLTVFLTRADGSAAAVDAGSMLATMGLGLVQGDAVTLSSDAPDCTALLDELRSLIESAE